MASGTIIPRLLNKSYLFAVKTAAISAIFLLNIAGAIAYAQPNNEGPATVPPLPKDRPALPTVSSQEAERLMGGPTLITLSVARANPRLVWENIARQAGLKLAPWDAEFLRRKWPLVTLRAQREPFWSVMQRFCEQVDWSLAFRPETGRWRVLAYTGEGRKWLTGLTQNAGPFQVLASSISTSTSAKLYWNTQNPLEQQQQQAASFYVLPDPHLTPLLLSDVSARCESAVDDQAHPLGVSTSTADFQKLSRDEGVRWHLSFSWPKTSSSKLADFAVNTSTLLALKREQWEVPVSVAADGRLETHASRTFETSQGRVTYQVHLTQDGSGYSVVLARPTDLVWKEPSFYFSDLPYEGVVRVVDGQGRNLYHNGGGSGATYQARMLRQDPWGKNGVGTPAKIIVNIPTDVRKLVVPFQFRSLPLQ